MKKVYVKDGEVRKVLDLGKQLKEARRALVLEKEMLRRKKISDSHKARKKENHEYKNGLGELKARWEGSVK